MSKNMSPIFDHTEGRLAEAIQFARERKDTSLITNIQWKRRCYGWEKQEVHIYPDFAPYSFEFSLVNTETKKTNLYGGIIFHGKHDNGGDGSAPTFSVNLTRVDGWATHT